MGVTLSGLFSAVHYGSHGTLLTSRKLNMELTMFLAIFIFINATLYKYFHIEHHKSTNRHGDTEPDGEIRNFWQYCFYCLNWDFIFAFKKMELKIFLGQIPYFIKGRETIIQCKREAVVSLLWIITVLLLSIYNFKMVLITYLIPLQVSWTMNFLMALPEHYGCDESSDKYTNTRSFYNLNPIMKYFYWNSNYHAEHHIYPKIPFYNLEEYSKNIKDKIKYQGDSYIKFHLRLIKSLCLFKFPNKGEIREGRVDSFNYKTYKVK